MVTITQDIKISLTKTIRQTLCVKQYDNFTREIKCSVYQDNTRVTVDSSTVIVVSGTCPDGAVFQIRSSSSPDTVYASDGCACFWVTSAMTAVAGKFPIDVTLTDSDGRTLGAFSIMLWIERAAVSSADTLALLSTGVSLDYDDTYTISDGYVVVAASQSAAASYSVSNGTVSSSRDTAVVTVDGTTLTATGVGTANLLAVPENYADTAVSMIEASDSDDTWLTLVRRYGAVSLKVTVSPADLTVMYLCGQSNAEGAGNGDRTYSVACDQGTVYSTYVPATTYFTDICGVSMSPSVCSAKDVGDYVAGSLTGTTSITGKTLLYPTDNLTTAGSGKKGPDSGLAYRWHELTGDKVWVINAAQSSSSITQWVDGGDCWEMFTAIQAAAAKTIAAEVAAGHYKLKNTVMFWQQGEADREMSASSYLAYFKEVCENVSAVCDAVGIITTRAYYEYGITQCDVNMTPPRAVQYAAGAGTDDWCANVYIASNTNELWTTADGVEAYFADKYSTGVLDYPMHTEESVAVPTTIPEVHDGAHYLQAGYNENGFTAAEGMYEVLLGTTELDGVTWKGFTWTDLDMLRVQYDSTADTQETAVAVPVADPCYAAKGISVVSAPDAVMAYDAELNTVTVSAAGAALLSELSSGAKVSAKAAVWEPVKNSNGIWEYCADGTVDTTFTGMARIASAGNWYYFTNGVLNWSYTGGAPSPTDGDLHYFSGSYMDESYTGAGLYDGRLYYFTSGVFDDSFNGTADYNDATYTFINGVSTEGGIGATDDDDSGTVWNLLPNTKSFSDSSIIKGSSVILGDTYQDFAVLYRDNSSGTSVTTVCEWADALEADGDAYYTLSFYAKGSGTMRCQFYGSDDTVEFGISSQGTTSTTVDGNINITLSDDWTRYWVTWHTLSGISGTRSVRPMRLTAGSVGYICGIKLESGYTATDWTPSEEDVVE